jgi:VanZ family protein
MPGGLRKTIKIDVVQFMKKINSRTVAWAAVVVLMALIFSFSAQPAPKSNELSGQTIRCIAKVTMPDFNKLPGAQQESFISSMQHITSKTTHFLIYLLLGVLCMIALLQCRLKIIIRSIIGFFICAGYAMSDEIHQLFVTGRSGQFTDILIDSCGIIIGIIIVIAFNQLRKRIKAAD